MSLTSRHANLRQEIAIEAARFLAEDGRLDYYTAKQKAMKRLGVSGQTDLPTNQEIESQLKIHQSMFFASTQPGLIKKMRQNAFSAMRMLEAFRPHLVGTVLEGTATSTSPIEIHVFSDSAKDILFLLMEKQIPYETLELKFRLNKNETEMIPSVSFFAGDYEIRISIFDHKSIHQKPISPITGLPMRRASLTKVKKLMAQENAD